MITHHRRFKSALRPQICGRELVKRGHHVTLIVVADTRRFGIREDDWDGVRVVEMPDLLWGRRRSGWDPWNMLHQFIWHRKNDKPYDLIHCFESRPTTIHPVLFYVKRSPTPLVLDWIDWWGRGGLILENRPRWYQALFGGLETYYEEHFRTRADSLTVISHAFGERAQGLGVDPNVIFRITDGADIDFFREKDRLAHRREYDLLPDQLVLGFAALDVTHDTHLAHRSLQIVKQTFPHVMLITTGRPVRELDTFAKELGVDSHFRKLGFLPYKDLLAALSCADVFLLPFTDKVVNRDRWPNKLGDYMSLGRPTVSNPVGQVKIFFGQEDVGLRAEEQPDDFADKIMQLLGDEALRKQLGKNSRAVAERRLAWPLLAEKLEGFYQQTVSRYRKAKGQEPQTAISLAQS